MLNLLRHLTARHSVFLIFSLALLGGFEYLMCAAVATVNVRGAIEELMKSVPPVVQAMVGNEFFAGLTTRGILAFGWNHPVAQALGAAVAIVLATRAVAGEIESGVMELLLSQPLSRTRYFIAQTSFAMLALATLSLVGALGTLIGQKFFRLEMFDTLSLLKLGLNFFLLQSAWFSLTLLLSVFGRESGRVASAAFLLALSSYLVQAIGTLWPAAAFLLPYSLYTYYSPQAVLVQNTLAGKSIAVLCSVVLICVGTAAWRFQRRDIP